MGQQEVEFRRDKVEINDDCVVFDWRAQTFKIKARNGTFYFSFRDPEGRISSIGCDTAYPLHNGVKIRRSLQEGNQLSIPHPFRPHSLEIRLGVITNITDTQPSSK